VKVGVIAQFADDIFQAIVAAVAAAEFKFRHTGWEIQLIVRDQDFIGGDAEKGRHRADSFATEVHKRGWHEQTNIFTGKVYARCVTEEFTFFFKRLVMTLRKQIDIPGTCVMAGCRIFRTWVCQANY
jgi:hypothetical protein